MKRTIKYKNKKKKKYLIAAFFLALIALVAIISFVVNFFTSKRHTNILPPSGTENKDINIINAEKQNTIKENATKENSIKDNQSSSLKNTDGPKIKNQPPPVFPAALPEIYGLVSEVLKDGKVIENYKRDYELSFCNADEYSSLPGITCFRGNNYRNSASYGTADIKEQKLEITWFSKTGYIDEWTGVGWTGQPAIVKWDANLRDKMNIFPSKKSKDDLKEVIYATLDGNIYFLDLDDGKPTRDPINIGYPLKGSVTIDPRGYPLLYAGQGIPEKEGVQGPIAFMIFSLLDQKKLYSINGYDRDALRGWGAFDSNGLVEAKTDTFIVCGENGILYTIKLNTSYNPEDEFISIKPSVVKYRYRSNLGSKIGTENSPAIYRNYIYFADNSGLLQCVDLNTLKPVWALDVNDDTDSSIALEEVSEDEVYIYTACELDKQKQGGFSFIRKINAFTGEIIWEKKIECYYDSASNGGAFASPIIGKNDIKNLVIYNIAKTDIKRKNGSKLIALDKASGKEVWCLDLKYYSWSSPVDVYSKDGKTYIIICDSGGFMRLLEGSSGKELHKIPLEANVEASPAVYENMIVVGTRGQKILGIRIK